MPQEQFLLIKPNAKLVPEPSGAAGAAAAASRTQQPLVRARPVNAQADLRFFSSLVPFSGWFEMGKEELIFAGGNKGHPTSQEENLNFQGGKRQPAGKAPHVSGGFQALRTLPPATASAAPAWTRWTLRSARPSRSCGAAWKPPARGAEPPRSAMSCGSRGARCEGGRLGEVGGGRSFVCSVCRFGVVIVVFFLRVNGKWQRRSGCQDLVHIASHTWECSSGIMLTPY